MMNRSISIDVPPCKTTADSAIIHVYLSFRITGEPAAGVAPIDRASCAGGPLLAG